MRDYLKRTRILRLWAVFGLMTVFSCPAFSQQWKELGPAPISNNSCTGRVSAIAVSAVDSGLYFLAGADGGVWRSRDGGQTWIPLTDGLPTTSMGALAIDPTDEKIIYAGSGEANFANHSRYGLGIFKSTDGGDSWEVFGGEVFGGRCISRVLIDPGHPQILYAAVTIAGGLPAFKFSMAGAKGHPLRNGPLGVFKSLDGGRTWTQLGGGLPGDLCATDLAMDSRNPRILYAAIGHVFGHEKNGIYKSADGGASWAKLGGGLPTSNFGRIALGTTPVDPNRIYAGFVQASDPTGDQAVTLNVYRSDDGGVAWKAKSLGNNIHSTYGYYLNVLAVSPKNPDVVFTGGVSFWRTTDGGNTWTNVGGSIHVDHHALGWDSSGRLLDGNDGGIYRTENSGESWVPLNNGLGLIQFYAGMSLHPKEPNILFAGCQDNGTLKRVGPNRNDWIQIFGGDGGYTAIPEAVPQNVFVEYQGTGNLYKSVNEGAKFVSSNLGIVAQDSNAFFSPIEFLPKNPFAVLYATQRLFGSLNGGLSWFSMSADLTSESGAAIRGMAIAPSNPLTIYIVTNDGRVQVTQNGGKTWNLSLAGIPGWPRIQRPFAVHPENHLEAFLAVSYFGRDQILKTADGGQHWASIDGDLPDIPVNAILIDEKKSPSWLFAGTDCGMFFSRDGGKHWETFGVGLPNCAVIDMRFDPLNQTLIVATQGRGMWEIAYSR